MSWDIIIFYGLSSQRLQIIFFYFPCEKEVQFSIILDNIGLLIMEIQYFKIIYT